MSWVGSTEIIDQQLEKAGADKTNGAFTLSNDLISLLALPTESPMECPVVEVPNGTMYYVAGQPRRLVDLLQGLQLPPAVS